MAVFLKYDEEEDKIDFANKIDISEGDSSILLKTMAIVSGIWFLIIVMVALACK